MNLNKMITIERRGQSQDATGQLKETWTKTADVWASIRPTSARDFYASSGARAEISHEIIIRHGPIVRPQDRILYNGRVFEVVAPMNIEERDRYIKMMSIERAGPGV